MRSKAGIGRDRQATSGFAMGPIDTHRSPHLSLPHKKALPIFPPSDKKAFSSIYPEVDEGVLRCWGLRRYNVGGVEVIGWEVGMGKA